MAWPNHALQRTRRVRRGCNHCLPCAGSLSLDVSVMTLRRLFLLFTVALIFNPRIAWSEMDLKMVPIVSVSAKGWTIKPGTPANGASRPTTILVNPNGEEFNIGETQYPDILPATLWIVEVKELKARFLVIRVPPTASAAVKMPILYINDDNTPSLAGSIGQRFEFKANSDDMPGFDPTIQWDGNHHLRDMLFKDSDGDGIPELMEDDVWKQGGTITYYRFTEQKSFVPLWKETWKMGKINDDYEMVSRIKIKNAKR